MIKIVGIILLLLGTGACVGSALYLSYVAKNFRAVFAVGCAILLTTVTSFIPIDIVLVKIGIWLMMVSFFWSDFITSVPEITGLVVINIFTGLLKAFGPGWHFKYPWEKVKEENFFSLDPRTEKIEETYAAIDDILSFKGLYQYVPDPRNLDKFIVYRDENAIKHGLKTEISGIISDAIGSKKSEDARKQIKDIEKEVINHIDTVCVGGVAIKHKLEGDYGINFKLFSIADIDFSKEYQAARSQNAITDQFIQEDKKIKAQYPDLSDKERANFMLLRKGNASKEIYEAEGNADKALLGLFMGALRGRTKDKGGK